MPLLRRCAESCRPVGRKLRATVLAMLGRATRGGGIDEDPAWRAEAGDALSSALAHARSASDSALERAALRGVVALERDPVKAGEAREALGAVERRMAAQIEAARALPGHAQLLGPTS